MFCANCGREIDNDQLFCPYCGFKVNQKEEEIKETNEPDNSSRKPIIIIVVVAAAIILGLIGTYLLLSGRGDGTETGTQVQDTTPPVITVIQDSIDKGKTFDIHDFVSVKDDVDGIINDDTVTMDGNIDTNVPGKYTIDVSVSDKAGNVATKEITIEVVQRQGDKATFIKKITGLWLNGCQSAKDAKRCAQSTGITDVSMTEFVKSGDQCMMTTTGDVKGEYDGDTVPLIQNGLIEFSYISPDLCTAKGTVNGMEISFDLGRADDQVIMYSCGGYYTHCAYTGFSTEKEMDDYLMN